MRVLVVEDFEPMARALAAGRSLSRILMRTAAGDLSDRVEGLNLGADDYLAKPFDFPELIARVRALGRRIAEPQSPVLRCGDIKLDPASRIASRAGQRLALSARELAVLEYLLGRTRSSTCSSHCGSSAGSGSGAAKDTGSAWPSSGPSPTPTAPPSPPAHAPWAASI
jgi:hypothetical protein